MAQINIYNIDHISDYFIKKEMNIIIKNTGSVPINLYSIFPGNTDIPLLNTTFESYVDNIENYYRVPIFANDVVRAKCKFWYFMKKLDKVKKASGEILACHEIFDRDPSKVKTYGIVCTYKSKFGYHNL